MVMNMQLF